MNIYFIVAWEDCFGRHGGRQYVRANGISSSRRRDVLEKWVRLEGRRRNPAALESRGAVWSFFVVVDDQSQAATDRVEATGSQLSIASAFFVSEGDGTASNDAGSSVRTLNDAK
jgi:hypothetical protein